MVREKKALERPDIKDPKVNQYVSHLEKQLESYRSENAIAKIYLGVKRQVDGISKVLRSSKFKLDLVNMSDKDDRLFDRGLKVLEKSSSLVDVLVELEKRVNPEVIEKEENKSLKGSATISVEKITNAWDNI